MKIKSLLFGSAAALVAVSGAYAADAVVVAEPEPAEYVRICDVYGAGYFYIPGTETCLRVGGYVRMDISGGEAGSFTGRATVDSLTGNLKRSYSVTSRFALKTWTGQETELGTLKTYTETRFDYTDGGNSATNLAFAWIQLGGLRMGRDESAFDTFQGYAGNVINDTLVPYGGFNTNLISYTFDAGNGFSAIVSLEQGSNYVTGVTDTIDSYMPHVVGGVKYTAGWGGVSAVAAYNSNWEEWSAKVRLDVNVSEQLSLFIMGGYGSDDNNLARGTDRHFYKPWAENWAIWGGGTYKVNEKTSLNLQVSYDEAEDLGIAANVSYDIVPGFNVTAELDYINRDTRDWTGIPAGKDDALGAFVRFQRSF